FHAMIDCVADEMNEWLVEGVKNLLIELDAFTGRAKIDLLTRMSTIVLHHLLHAVEDFFNGIHSHAHGPGFKLLNRALDLCIQGIELLQERMILRKEMGVELHEMGHLVVQEKELPNVFQKTVYIGQGNSQYFSLRRGCSWSSTLWQCFLSGSLLLAPSAGEL